MAKTGILGKASVIRDIRRMSVEVERAADTRAHTEAVDLAGAIEAAAPVLSGATKASVRVEPGSRPGIYIVRVGGVPATRKGVREGVKEADLAAAKQSGGNKGEYDYPEGVEFGHKTPDGGHVPAHPFVYPTYRARKPGILRRLRSVVSATISKFNLGNG